MSFGDSMMIALRALRANALRSMLTMLGIIIGVGAVIVMLAVGTGARLQIEEELRNLGSNLLQILPRGTAAGGVQRASGTGHTLTDRDAAAIATEIPHVVTASPSVRRSAQLVRAGRNWNAIVNGTTPGYFIAREWGLSAGRMFGPHDVESGAKVALIGATVARELFPDGGAVGGRMRIAGVPFTVAGVLDKKGTSGTGRDQDDIVFVPITTAQRRLMGGAHMVSRQAVAYILVKVTRPQAMDRVEGDIQALLRQRHGLGPEAPDDFEVRDPAAVMEAQREASRILSVLLAAVASVSLVVGGISIMNIMLVSVTERTREIGLRMAVGAEPRHIRDQFLVEAVVLCLMGGGVGVALGIAGAALVSVLVGWPVFVGPGTVVLAVGFAAAVGVCFGFYPALKASRMDAIEALRFE